MTTGGVLHTSSAANGSRRGWLRPFTVLATAALLGLAIAPFGAVEAKDKGQDPGTGPTIVAPAVQSDVSPPLSSLAPAAVVDVKTKKEKKKNDLPAVPSGSAPDTVVQSGPGGAAAPSTTTSFDGIGVGLGTYSPRWAPPDTEGAVGPNHYFEIVNADIAIFSKAGALIYGPAPTNTLWSGFGGGCQTHDDGDGIVEYDRLANRWVVTQFTNDGTNTQCVAVSTTADPTGTYARYAFTYPAFPDYPKLAVWPDAYYITFNLFGNSGFAGGMVCAYDRAKMLAGSPATQLCYNLGTSYGGLLPSDVDGTTPPPAGSPDFVANYGTNRLNLWKFHVDWAAPANSTLSGPTAIATASFSAACGGGTCIPQPGTSQKLDSLADRLMSRLAYRNFGDHESLVVNQSVATGYLNQGPTGVRWYELRNPNGAPAIYQQGTYAPDSTYRWMGSVAMDQAGNIGLGYSASSSSVRPSVRYTGHLVSDPLGVMGQGEGVIQGGSGSQLPSLSRWGDYSSMTVDPSDDCTFWYVGEYLKADGTFNWSTRIGSFKFPTCGPSSATVPGVPTGVTATAGDAQATVSFNPPTSDGGSTITSYTATSTPGSLTGTGTASPVTVTGLSNGTAYTFTVHATNIVGSGGESSRSNIVTPTAPPLSITTTSLPSGTVSQAYNATVQATGGTGPYTWSIASGILPAGLNLAASTGTISGTPTTAGTANFTVRVTDSSSPTAQTATQALSIVINPASPPPLTITTTGLPSSRVNRSYGATVQATGGTGAYVWSIASGALPPGLTLTASTGRIAGTPTRTGTYSFTVSVHDSASSPQTATKTLSIRITKR